MQQLGVGQRREGREVDIRRISFQRVSAKKKQHIVNEVNTLTTLNYPHLLRYYDYTINRKELTVDITVERCDGGNLQEVIRKHRADKKAIEESTIWDYFYQLVQVIEFVHSKGVIHRDLCPSHVLFKDSKHKHIRLAGFGQAKTLDLESQFGSTVLPNTHYLSPEQVEQGTTTTNTDVWGLGCLIYEMAALQPPFHHHNQFERVRRIKQQMMRKLPYSTELNRVVRWCLNKNPQERPKVADLINCPEISIRIRKIRYLKAMADLESKERRLQRREDELKNREREFQNYKESELEVGLSKTVLSSQMII